MMFLFAVFVIYAITVFFSGFCILQYSNLMNQAAPKDYNQDLNISHSPDQLSAACRCTFIPVFNLIVLICLIPDVWYLLKRSFFLKMYQFIKDEIEEESKIE